MAFCAEPYCASLSGVYIQRNAMNAMNRGVDPYATGGHVPPIFGLVGHYHESPPNISRVILVIHAIFS